MKLWLVGGAGTVKVVLLFKWETLNSGMVNGMKRVRGHVEVYDLDPAGNERLLQNEVIIITHKAFRM
jgi:hypothetical protein